MVGRGPFECGHFEVTIWAEPGSMATYMSEYFLSADEEHQKREKAKARELRNSQWWKRKRSSGTCYYCGRKFKPADLTMDHLIPVARGGKSTQGNLVPACKDCNNKKKYLMPTEWDEYLQSIKIEEE